MQRRRETMSYRRRLLELAAPLLALLFALLVGGIFLLAIGKDPLQVYLTMFRFNLSRLDSIGSILYKSTPLIFSGLAVAVGFRVGLFNIGVEGQYFIGALLASIVGFSLHGLPVWIHLPLVVLAGMLGGMLWAWLPIVLKLRRGAHEVITTIMMNHIAYALVLFFITSVFLDTEQEMVKGLGSPQVRMPKLLETARMPTMHGFLETLGIELPRHVYLNWFFPLGILLAVALFVMLWRAAYGYELRAVGGNPAAAETAGINTQRTMLSAFLLSGALAGLVGLSDLLGYFGYLDIDFPKGYGFTGIAVALLARNSMLGVILTAILFGFLRRGAEGVQAFEGVPMDTIVILEGVIILSIVVAVQIVNWYVRRQEKLMKRRQVTMERAGGD